jgi:hypothetical protein
MNKEDKQPPRITVFDSLFLSTITDETEWNTPEYNYKKGRSSAQKRLRGRCPKDFDLMIFFCNKDRKHWINFALYPKKRLICVIDSYGDSAKTYAMIIFRWLYDEMHFNWQEDAKKMFLAYEPCGGWTYRVDPKCKKQRDGHQCGVCTPANASCLMIGINMDILTEAVIERFWKLILSRLCSFKNLKIGGQPKLRPAAPWYRGPTKLRLPTLKMVSSLDTRSTTFSRPSVRAMIPSGT